MGVPDIQQAAKATDNFGLLKSSLEQCDGINVLAGRQFSQNITNVY